MPTQTQVKPAPKPSSASAPGVSLDGLALEVERILRDLQAQFQRLSGLAGERLEAMRRADTARLARCIAQENEVVQQVAEIEKRRIVAVGRLAERLGSSDKSQAKASWLGERLGGAAGERLTRSATELRTRIESLMKSNEVARLTALTLSSHMEGLWRQALQVLNHSKTYGRMGVVGPGATVISAVDVRS